MQLSVQGDRIEGDGISFKGTHPTLRASLVGERVFVIYDWMAFDRNQPARNLFCYDRSGNLLWRAPDIDWGAVDAYTNITSEEPLWVGNFAGFDCRVDELTGQVLEMRFTK